MRKLYCTLFIVFLIGFGNSKAQVANVQDSLQLVDLYDSTDGANWTNHNGWMNGPVRTWFGIVLNSNGRVVSLDLHNNNLIGDLPNLNLPFLQGLVLHNNQISGTVPAFSLPALLDLNLVYNQITGPIPNFNLPAIRFINLGANQFSGELPNLAYPSLISLILASNNLSGEIPNFTLNNLEFLNISGNQFTGNIPPFSLPALKVMHIGSNQLTGSIPTLTLPALTDLSFTGNQLTGPIPNFNFPNLVTLNLNHNQLSGSLPDFNMPALTTLDVSYNQLAGTIPDFPHLLAMQRFHLEANKFSGEIPNFNFPALKIIDLGGNQLTGSIPAFSFPALHTLSLNNNKLSGPVPVFSIPDTTAISLAFNNLLFDGLEHLAQQYTNPPASYSPQATVIAHKKDSVLSVTAGGTLANNKYEWYRNNQLVATITSDSTYTSSVSGLYSVKITNNVATVLTLESNNNLQMLAPIHRIDPNPSLVNDNGTLNTNLSALDLNKTVIGAATDGITPVLLYTSSTIPLRFWVADSTDGLLNKLGSADKDSVSVTVAPVNGKVAVVYKVPNGLGNAGDNLTVRQILVRAAPLTAIDSTLIHLTLITPPVVLVHGMWSNPAIWETDDLISGASFVKKLKGANFETPNLVNYEQYNSRTYNPDDPESVYARHAIQREITEALGHLRANRFAATQLDFVGHSLGGLQVRSFSQRDEDFLHRDNFKKGYVHKLITIGTPHRGSPFGPELYDHSNDLVRLPSPDLLISMSHSIVREIMDAFNKPLGSCHRDFGINSAGINALKTTPPFLSYAITANYKANGVFPEQTGMYNMMNALSLVLFQKRIDTVFKSRCGGGVVLENDIIVPMQSQKGYINKDTLFWGTAHSGPANVTEGNNPFIQDKVVRLLLSNDTTEFARGFPRPSDFPIDDCNNQVRRTAGTSNKLHGEELIKISSPTRGSVIPGNSTAPVTLSIETSGGAVPATGLFLIAGIGGYPIPQDPPYSVTITLPANVPVGKVEIIALVRDTSGLLLGDTSHVILLPSGTLDSLVVNPGSIELDSLIRMSPVFVKGYYNNNNNIVMVDITKGSTGTTYAAKQGNVFNVNADGVVKAIAPGTDTLIIGNSSKTVKIPVKVATNFQNAVLYSNTIDFPAIPDKTYGDDIFSLTASSTSGDEVVFTIVSGPATIQNGILIIDTTGQVTVKASQAGNAYFAAATDVQRTFCVRPISPVATKNCNTLSSNISGGNQWYKDGVAIAGATNQDLFITSVGTYTAKVTSNGCQSISSNSIVVTGGSFTPTPVISAGGTTTFCTGGSVTLSSDASSGNQWYKNGTTISGATAQTFNSTESGTYTVKATLNSCESAVSNAISVTVNAIPVTPAITAGTATTFCNGGSLTLTSNAANGNQWYKDGTVISNATATTLNVTSSGAYTVKITISGCESAVSNSINVTVNPIPATPTITINGNQLVSSVANGNQWYLNGVIVNGATAQNYTPVNSGNYTVQVTVNGCSSAFSTAINFTVTSVPDIDVFGREIKVLPNPVREQLLVIRSGVLSQLYIRIFDIHGRELQTLISAQSRIEIDMQRYAAGTYIIWIEDRLRKINGKKVIIKL